jgi:hypothetical protein
MAVRPRAATAARARVLAVLRRMKERARWARNSGATGAMRRASGNWGSSRRWLVMVLARAREESVQSHAERPVQARKSACFPTMMGPAKREARTTTMETMV